MAKEIEKEVVETKKDNGDELVTRFYFKDNDRYKFDIPVQIGNQRLLVKRGEQVQIPKRFADIIDQSEHQKRKADAWMSQLMNNN